MDTAVRAGLDAKLLRVIKSPHDRPLVSLVWALSYGELEMRAFVNTSAGYLGTRPRTAGFILQGACELCASVDDRAPDGLCTLCWVGDTQSTVRPSLIQRIEQNGITAHDLRDPEGLLTNMTVGNPLLATLQFDEVRTALIPWAIEQGQRLIAATPTLPLFPALSDAYPEVFA